LSGGAAPLVSVIVPAYAAERTIGACVASLAAQQAAPPFEVIVVDSSPDETPDIVEREFSGIRLIRLGSRTPAGAARNRGVREARGSFLLMIDTDCVAEPDLIARMLARHREETYAAVGGALVNGTPRSVSGWIGYLLEFKESMPRAPRRETTSVPTANVMYRRDAFEAAGGFDEQMWMAEDLLLHWRMVNRGARILFDPEIRAIHLNRTGWRQVLAYQIQLGRWSAIARRKGGLPGHLALRVPPLVLLLPVARTLRAFAWLAAHDVRGLAAFFLAWPLYLIAATFWAGGFLAEAQRPPRDAAALPSRL
jgi:GT2 family glycosyltransferase